MKFQQEIHHAQLAKASLDIDTSDKAQDDDDEDSLLKEELPDVVLPVTQDSKNPYLLSIPKNLKANKYSKQYKRKMAQTVDFQYDHRQFIPKKSFYSSRREENDYKRSIKEDGLNDESLSINQAAIKDRYQYYLDKKLEFTDVSQQAH